MMNWMLAVVLALGIINASDDVKSHSVDGPSMMQVIIWLWISIIIRKTISIEGILSFFRRMMYNL